MSTLSTALSNALSGLHVTQTGISVVSGNVAGATDPNYTKKTVSYTSSGTVTMGASVASIQRATNNALQSDLVNYTSIAGMTSAQSGYLSQLNTIFGGSSNSPLLSTDMEAFVSAWQSLQTTPSDTSAQQAVVAKANTLTSDIQTLSTSLENVDGQVATDISDGVTTANGLLSDISDLNTKIITGKAQGSDVTSLQDTRDTKITALAKYVDVKPVSRSDGSIALYTSSGVALVDHSAGTLSYDSSTNKLSLNSSITLNGSGNNTLRAGSLLGLANLRDTSNSPPGAIQQLRDQLDTFANSLIATTDTTTGESTSFSDAYDNNSSSASGTALSTGFFTSSTTGAGARKTIEVNSSLLDGTATVNPGAIDDVVTALTAKDRTFKTSSVNSTDSGLSMTGQDYTGMTTGMASWLSQKSGTATSSADVAESSRSNAQTLLSSDVGVNMDDELANLQTLQNAYAASAHVLTVVNDLYDKLFSAVN